MACVSSVCGRRYSGEMKRHIKAYGSSGRYRSERLDLAVSPVSQFLNSQLSLLLDGSMIWCVCSAYFRVYVFYSATKCICVKSKAYNMYVFACVHRTEQMCERYKDVVLTLWRFSCQKCPIGNVMSPSRPYSPRLFLPSFLSWTLIVRIIDFVYHLNIN